jgi:hypothetical protein
VGEHDSESSRSSKAGGRGCRHARAHTMPGDVIFQALHRRFQILRVQPRQSERHRHLLRALGGGCNGARSALAPRQLFMPHDQDVRRRMRILGSAAVGIVGSFARRLDRLLKRLWGSLRTDPSTKTSGPDPTFRRRASVSGPQPPSLVQREASLHALVFPKLR